MTNKKILIVSPSLKIGGIERALTVLANYFVTRGYEIIFISCLSGDKFYSLHENVRLVEPNFKNTGGIQKIFFYIKLLFFLRSEIKKASPGVVLSFGDWFNPIVLFSLLGLKYPVYISDRTSPDYKFNIITSLGKKLLYPKSSGFIAQTKRSANFKTQQFGDKLNIKIISNAIRKTSVVPDSKQNILLFVGRFAWEKAPERLLEAFSKLANKTDWKLHFAGDGPMLNEMKLFSKELKIDDKVVFHGAVSNIDELYSKASIYAIPSKVEGFPNALCEAMSFALPCICFDDIPYEDIIINGHNGFVIPDGNIKLFSEKILELINNESLRFEVGLNAQQFVQKLSPETIGEEYLKFITEKMK